MGKKKEIKRKKITFNKKKSTLIDIKEAKEKYKYINLNNKSSINYWKKNANKFVYKNHILEEYMKDFELLFIFNKYKIWKELKSHYSFKTVENKLEKNSLIFEAVVQCLRNSKSKSQMIF